VPGPNQGRLIREQRRRAREAAEPAATKASPEAQHATVTSPPAKTPRPAVALERAMSPRLCVVALLGATGWFIDFISAAPWRLLALLVRPLLRLLTSAWPKSTPQVALRPIRTPLAPKESTMSRHTVGADRLLLLYALVVGWLCIYVPWSGRGRYGRDLGYWFVWDGPKEAASVDLTRLVLELVAATAALVALAVCREWWRRRRGG
jgi:hypothetical protein